MALVLNVSLRFKKGPEISFILVRTMQIGPGMIQQVQGQVWLQVKNRRLTLIGNSSILFYKISVFRMVTQSSQFSGHVLDRFRKTHPSVLAHVPKICQLGFSDGAKESALIL